MNKRDLPPSAVVVQCVLQYSATMPMMGHAAVLGGQLILLARNHLGAPVSLAIPVHFDGEPFDGGPGMPPRWVLSKLGPAVWSLSPSILHDLLHAFILIVNVPDDVTWGRL